MKKYIIILAILFLSSSALALTGMIGATLLTGGTSAALDSYDGSTLNDGDPAIVVTDGFVYIYRLDASSTLSEASPKVIAPDSNGGTVSGSYKRWELQEVMAGSTINTLANDATPTVLTGSKFLTGGTTTITDFDDGYTGKIIIVIAEHSLDITDGTNIFLSGSANWSMTATDTLTLIQKANGTWLETGRSDSGA